MKKLRPMTKFVLERKEYWEKAFRSATGSVEDYRASHSEDCEDYANFISRKPELFQFIPCDELGIPIANKIIDIDKLKLDGPIDKQEELKKEYETALKKVLFKDFILEPAKNKASHGRLLSLNGRNVAGYNDLTKVLGFIESPATIEELIGTDIELMPTQACMDIIG